MTQLQLFCLPLALFIISCDQVDSTPTAQVRLVLQNQSDHSGISLKVTGIDTIFVSDAEGSFNLDRLTAGEHMVQIRYPFFEEIDTVITKETESTSIDFRDTLEQLVQFWIVPKDTVVQRTARGELVGLVTNLSDSPVFYSSATLGINRAIIPLDLPWPSPDCIRCEQMKPSNQGQPSTLFINPGDTLVAGLLSFQLGLCHYTCYTPSMYDAYIGFVDRSSFSDYYKAHLTADSLYGLWLELNASLLRKRELFSPATITFSD